jgi:hypothetical protein
MLVFFFLPVGAASWLALTAFSLYMLLQKDGPSSRRRGAKLLLAATLPMFWSRLLLHFFAQPVLAIDASMIGWLMGSERVGNMVRFADGSGNLVIFPGCSSLAGVSIAVLCWVTVSHTIRHRRSAEDFVWCGLACVSVVAVNTARMSIMSLSEWHYQVMHGQWVEEFANAITLFLVVGFSLLGVRRELFTRI